MTRRLVWCLLLCSLALGGCDDDTTASDPVDATAAPADSTTAPPTSPPTPDASPTTGFGSSVSVDEADVRSELEVRVAETISEFDGQVVEDGTLLTVPAEVLFDVDEATLRPDARATLDRLVEVVQFYDEAPLQVVGHTDSDGTDAYNQDLSTRRADAVASYLFEQGVARDRVRAEGRGESEPVASNDSAEGRQQNRRVELLLVGMRADGQ